ncbi:MAG: LacI family DNA-binding transcriptional regulator [Halanaerobiaceae bacterium]
MPNINDIAREANVSISTVSKVINDYPDVSEKTKKKVYKIMNKYNYIPNSVARSLSTNKSQLIGIFFNYSPQEGIHNMFFQEIIYGLEKVLGKKGYDYVYFSEQRWQEEFHSNYLGKCRDRMVDGVVMLGIEKNESFFKLLESDLPVVLIDQPLEEKNTSYISCDHFRGAKNAVNYFFQNGHRKIGMISGPSGLPPVERRNEGFFQAIKELGLEYNQDWVLEAPSFREKDTSKIMEQILQQQNPPTALFFHSDVMAIGAMKKIKQAGLSIPDDFSLIGFDDIEICKYLSPPLTTVCQNTYKIGEKAAELLLKIILFPEQEHTPCVLETELIRRDSVREL